MFDACLSLFLNEEINIIKTGNFGTCYFLNLCNLAHNNHTVMKGFIKSKSERQIFLGVLFLPKRKVAVCPVVENSKLYSVLSMHKWKTFECIQYFSIYINIH